MYTSNEDSYFHSLWRSPLQEYLPENLITLTLMSMRCYTSAIWMYIGSHDSAYHMLPNLVYHKLTIDLTYKRSKP